jgi:hypothetical protein
MTTYCTGPDGEVMNCDDAYRAHQAADSTAADARRDCEKYGLNCNGENGIEWSGVGEGLLDFFTAFSSGWTSPTSSPRGPNYNIQTRERKTGFDWKKQWPWLALGGVGIVLLSRRN